MPSRRTTTDLASLAAPGGDEEIFEPHVAIDPADPCRAAAVAVYPTRNRGLGRGMWCWTTVDGGATWNDGGRIPQAQFDGEGVADPLIAYGPEGTLFVVAMTYPGALVEARHAIDSKFNRFTSPTVVERMQSSWGSADIDVPTYEKICLSRSEDHGRTWTSTIVPNSVGSDKTSLAVDNRPDSPFRGHVYAAWSDVANEQVAFMRATDSGRVVEPAIRVGAGTGGSSVQLAVGAGGIVHMLWSVAFWKESFDLAGRTPIYYVQTVDGGVTFSDPVVIAEHAGLDGMATIDLSASPDGSLLAAWPEPDVASVERGVQPRSRIHWTRSSDGKTWSPPSVLASLPADVSQGLPAVAATDGRWHVLSYDAGVDQTVVQVYSADEKELAFTPTHTLATRPVGLADIYLHTNYQLRWAYDLINVGDYVGLAGSGSTLAAAIALPEFDDPKSQVTAFAGVFSGELDS